MKMHFKKITSLFLALSMIISFASHGLMMAFAANSLLIDMSFPNLNNEEDVDYISGARRAQIINFDEDIALKKIALLIKQGQGDTDLKLSFVKTKDGKPDESDVIKAFAIERDQVPTEFDPANPLEIDFGGIAISKGTYALVYNVDSAGQDGVSKTYKIPQNNQNGFSKGAAGGINWDVYDNWHYWIKVYAGMPSGETYDASIDMTFDHLGLLEGVDYANHARRAQIIKFEETVKLNKIDLLIKTDQGTSDLVLSLVQTIDGKPDESQVVKTFTIPRENVPTTLDSENPLTIDFEGTELIAGTYALVFNVSNAGGGETNNFRIPQNENAEFSKGAAGAAKWDIYNGWHYWMYIHAVIENPAERIVEVDYSFDVSGTEDIDFDAKGGARRAQLFELLKDVKLNDITINVTANAGDNLPDLVVALHNVADSNSKIVPDDLSLIKKFTFTPNEVRAFVNNQETLEVNEELSAGTYAVVFSTDVKSGEKDALSYKIPNFGNAGTTLYKSWAGSTRKWDTAPGAHWLKLNVTTKFPGKVAPDFYESNTNPGDDENLVIVTDPISDSDTNYLHGVDSSLDYSFDFKQTESLGNSGAARRGMLVNVTEAMTLQSITLLLNYSNMYHEDYSPVMVTLYQIDSATNRPNKNYYARTTVSDVPNGQPFEAVFNHDNPVYLPVGKYAVVIAPTKIDDNYHYQIPLNPQSTEQKIWAGSGRNFDGPADGQHWMILNATTKIEKGQTPYPRKIEVTVEDIVTYVNLGKKFTPEIEITDQYGALMTNESSGLIVSSENTDSVTVEGHAIKAVKPGTSKILYKAGTVSASIYVRAYDAVVDKILGQPNLSLEKGETLDTDYHVMDEWKFKRDDLKDSLVYSIENTDIASVNSNGVITAKSAGETVMTVQYADFTKKVSVNVYVAADSSLYVPVDGAVITQSVKFKPGVYILPNGLKVGADNIIIDGNGATILGVENYPSNPELLKGYGIASTGFNNVKIRNLNAHHYDTGLVVKDAKGWVVEFNNFSDNFTNPDYGWDNMGYKFYHSGAIYVTDFENGIMRYNNGSNVWTALDMTYSNKNKVYENDFGICSNFSLRLWGSSYNEIHDNIMNWGIRMNFGETHARDSTSTMIEYNSNYNYIARNDFSHGGDGIFIRPLHGAPPMGNYFEANDVSWANNNGVESWAPGNVFVANVANYSSYGFWIGGSDFTYMINNEARFNGGNGGASNAVQDFGNAGFTCARGDTNANVLMMGNTSSDNYGPGLALQNNKEKATVPAYNWIVQNNIIENNLRLNQTGHGIFVDHADMVQILSNQIMGNEQDAIHQTTSGSAPTRVILGNNSALTTVKMPSLNVSVEGAEGNFNFADIHMKNIPEQIKEAEFGIVKIMNVSVVAGENVTFKANAVDPQGKALSYLWDFSDAGAGEFHTENATVSFDKPGTYTVGMNVSNGEMANLQGIILTVLPNADEIVTDNLSDWSANNEAVLSIQPIRKLTGDGALEIYQEKGQSLTLTYPAKKDMTINFIGKDTLGLLLDVEVEWGLGESVKAPVIRLHKDKNNYIEFKAKRAFNSPIQVELESRYSYQNRPINLLSSDENYDRSVVGSVGLDEIKYFEIDLATQKAGKKLFRLDGIVLSPNNAPITGEVEIEGTTTFGNVLSANIEGLSVSDGLNYTWKRISEAGTEVVENGETYTIRAEDVGHKISLTVKAEGYSGSVVSPSVGPIAKAFASKPLPPTATDILEGNTVTLTVSPPIGEISDYKYAVMPRGVFPTINDWKNSNVFSGLTKGGEYDLYVIKLATATHLESEPSDAFEMTLFNSSKTNQPKLEFTLAAITKDNSVSLKITLTSTAHIGLVQYSLDGINFVDMPSNEVIVDGLKAGSLTKVYMRALGDDDFNPSYADKEIILPKITQKAQVDIKQTNFKVTKNSIQMISLSEESKKIGILEYRLNNGEWIILDQSKLPLFENLASDKEYLFEIRVKESETHQAGDITLLVIRTSKTDDDIKTGERPAAVLTSFILSFICLVILIHLKKRRKMR